MDPQASASSSYWQKTIGAHPGTAAAILGVLVLAVLILAFVLHDSAGKGKFVGESSWPASMSMRYVGWPRAEGPAFTPVEGLTAGPGAGGGALYLRPGPPALCGRGWDPAASAEAEALATVGALQHESYGEGRLQGAIDAAYDSSHGLSDDQLAALMHQGGAP